jgi:DNA-binding transcriptional ArsR family regulator
MSDTLSAIFAALADPTRRAILAVSKHLKVLERAGLITQGRKAQWRPCQIEAAPLKAAADYLALYQQLWGARFDRLDSYLGTMSEEEQAP